METVTEKKWRILQVRQDLQCTSHELTDYHTLSPVKQVKWIEYLPISHTIENTCKRLKTRVKACNLVMFQLATPSKTTRVVFVTPQRLLVTHVQTVKNDACDLPIEHALSVTAHRSACNRDLAALERN